MASTLLERLDAGTVKSLDRRQLRPVDMIDVRLDSLYVLEDPELDMCKFFRGQDGKVDLRRAASVIIRLRPDLVALQEVDHRARRSGQVDQAAELGKMTGMHHAFGSFFDFEGGKYGMAILKIAGHSGML